MAKGHCRGVLLRNLEDRDALVDVTTALQETCAANELLSRTHVALVALTPVGCALEEMATRVEQVLGTMQIQQLDLLLLQAQSLTGSKGLHERKRAVLEAWEHMMVIQQAGLVQRIGTSDLSIQDVDFLLTAYPENPPEAWSIELLLPGMTSTSSDSDVPLEDVTAFAHAHSIDVLVRFPFAHLDSIKPEAVQEDWGLLTRTLADRYRERPFKFLVAHENEGTVASYHMESHALSETTVMQTSLQIAVRYLLQKGLVVIPQGFYDLQQREKTSNYRSTHEATMREIFEHLAHPFTTTHPSCSPQKMYSSLLTREDLAAIDRALPLATSFPLPAPPRTPISTTGRSRPGSRQDRRMHMPTTLSRPPTAD
ncbi:unnamed protein product [Phytophthora lilii]|uniref:Unnamed protein product n=1 Tax=Phytophthora lilii TaxID=2077276 RepID=A0A9W6TK29_9STRA|nr:unnamed protein product [Phytophthora lilii]